MNKNREPAEHLQAAIVVPSYLTEEEKEQFEEFAENDFLDHFSKAIYERLKKEPLAIRVLPIVKNKVSYGLYEDQMELRACVQVRKFTFCEKCPAFMQDGFNGGFCTKMHEVVHITDGCTLAPFEEEDQ